MAKTQIKNYIFKPGIGANDNLYPNAYDLLSRNKLFIQKEATAWIQDQVNAGTSGFVGYTYNVAKCERDIGFVIDAYLFDLRYGGNEKTRNTIKYYWDQDVAQVDGDRQPEIQTHTFIGILIEDFILANIAYDASNTQVTQTIDLTKTAESQAIDKIAVLVSNTVEVITTGLSALPVVIPSGVSTIKVQGRLDLEDILLITNTTTNEIIYNFSNPQTGAAVEIKTDGIIEDNDFVAFLQATDAITTITLNYNTINQTSTDELQIFVERTENGKSITTTRPYDFGTDAIERMRVAQPASMLDADFEYGLQPTKWAAISTLRGYPSVYEIPGTDAPVLSVVTDASVGTDGVGQSLITVTTVSPHGLSAGTPITIKALEDSVVGAARAEGSFVITEVTSNNTFTYFAKSKVGNTAGDVLSTTFTQLREAGFYTGSNIGTPSIEILSNGTFGEIETQLAVLQNSTVIPFDGTAPEIGAPLVDISGAIVSGTQVTGINKTSGGGGTYITPLVIGSYDIGDNSITVQDSTGIVLSLAVDRGDGIAMFLNNINQNTLTFSQPFTAPVKGNIETYIGVSGSNINPQGQDATFDISRSSGVYTVALNTGGTDYQVGDNILISGNSIGGTSPEHDITITVTVANSAITTFDFTGIAFNGVATVENISPIVNGGVGLTSSFDILIENNTYVSVDVPSPNSSVNYAVNDIIVIPGNTINPNGITPENDAKITVTSVSVDGSIISASIVGTAPDAFVNYDNPSFTTSGTGVGLDFSVLRSGTVYSVDFINFGSGFVIGDTISIIGTNLGGTTTANDLTITVSTVGAGGEIQEFIVTGTAVNTQALLNLTGNNLVGSTLDINVGLNLGVYSVVVNNGGLDYGPGQTFTINGSILIGTSPENDLTLTVDTVDNLGAITAVIVSGVANGDISSHIAVLGENITPIGTGAVFSITRNNGTYSAVITNAGTGYADGNRIEIPGDILGGTQPNNNLVLQISQTANGTISDVVPSGIADRGNDFDLISTILISEPTTAALSVGATISFEALATLEIEFDTAHGLVPGNTFIVTVDSDDGVNNHKLAAGSFFATEIPTVNTLRYQARAPGTIDTDNGADSINSEVYPRPDSFFVHRPFDGGVQLGTGGPQHGAQAIRQSKKYIRYQSGKGIMYTTGALFAPSYDLRSITADGVEVNSLITVTTDDNDHGLQVGGIIRLLGIETPGYNSGPQTAVPPQFDYQVVAVIDERTFQIRSKRRLGSTNAVLGFDTQMSVVAWHGATVRSGIFDDQNGLFWEFDGTQISVVQRTGTKQIAGTIAMTVNDNLVTGTNTKFRDQLKAGDRIVIKGMTHVVSHVNSQTEITVTPDWRGVVNINGAKANLITDKKVKQPDFNLDRLDGTGPSGYKIDIAKMQMIGIQYSWYGAGFIDFMLRGADGNFVFAHRMRNSNVNTEAFMRSGNLPVRYEVTNEGPSGKLASAMTDNQTTMILEDTSFFPNSGVVYVDNEIISFSGNNKSTNTLTGLIRSATFTNFQSGATRAYTAGPAVTHDARTGVVLISQTITPLISHWGSAFITDGLFDEDRGYLFSYAETNVEITTIKQTAFLIRLSPSVSNALVGDLGERELLNRAQLLLQGLEITSDGTDNSNATIKGGIVIEGVLNPQNYPIDPSNIGWSGLSGVAQGGQPSFAQIASGGSVSFSTGDTPVVANITAQGIINQQFTTSISGGSFQNAIQNNQPRFFLTDSNAAAANIQIGDVVSAAYFPAGTRVISINTSFQNRPHTRYETSQNATETISSPATPTINILRGNDLTNRNFGLFTKVSVDTAGVTVGTAVTGGTVTFPANTQVNTIQLFNLGTTEYFEIQFNNSYTGTLTAGTGTVELTFAQPPFAQPGETIFSFIAVPGERATLDLSDLKELTNTPLGGRGTYPNGPDVLAINVFKVSGAALPANIILRWSEAQA